MSPKHSESVGATQHGIHAMRLLLIALGVLILLLAFLANEYKLQLLLAGIALLLVGWFLAWIARHYRIVAILLLNTLLLFTGIELASTALLATTTIPAVRGVLADVMGRPNKIVAHYFAQPYYSEQEWASQYWQELESALSKSYHPYVIWRSPSFSGITLNIDQDGIRRTPGSDCIPSDYKVFVFGGSSIWGWGAPDWGTIPAYLQDKLQEIRGEPVCVVNFGENAFVSTQSVIQLTLLLEAGDVPDMAIFYDGVNEVLAASETGQPIVHQNLDEIARLFQDPQPSLIRWLQDLNSFQLLGIILEQSGVSYGDRNYDRNMDTDQLADLVTRAYLNNYRTVGSLAHTYGFDYYFFWQPHILIGDKPLTPEEKGMITGLNWVLEMDSTLISLFTKTYEEVDSAASNYENLYSLSHVFDGEASQIWLDTWGHVTPVGNELIATALSGVIMSKWLESLDSY